MTTAFSMSLAAFVQPANGFGPTPEVGTFTGRRARIPADLVIVCLWSAVGLVLTALFAGLGFGNEITQSLAAAG